MNLLMRERWPLAAGIVGAAAVVVAFALAGLGDRAASGWRPLGVTPGGWGLALLVLAVFLVIQLALAGRISLRRERRLVETAAALRVASAQLQRLATTDTLTGLFDRRVFWERLGVEFRRSLRYGRPLALLMVDLDRFKRVNDEHGHPFGDFVLAETAHAIRASLRESDVVARYGGEEFVVMLPETDAEAAANVAEKLRAAVGALELTRGGITAHMTVSVGISTLPGDGLRDARDLVERADEALYRAKREGRDRVVAAA